MVNFLAPFDGFNYPTLHLAVPQVNNFKKIFSQYDINIEIVKECKLSFLQYLKSIGNENKKKNFNILLFLFPPANKLTKLSGLNKEQTVDKEIMINIHIQRYAFC